MPPPLPYDAVEEILLRLPPRDPGCLFHASLVCKPWRTMVTNPSFARRYREFHRTPPLLGFFENDRTLGCWFAPLTPTSPFLPIHPGRRNLYAIDSRHGRVLLNNNLDSEGEPVSLVVWDPIGHRQWELPYLEIEHRSITYYNAAVLCAANGCDHLDCHGGPFLVAYVVTDDEEGNAYASLYSSEARAWSPVTSCEHPDVVLEILRGMPMALVGNAVYVTCDTNIILRYDLLSQELSMIDRPAMFEWDILMTTEDGALGCADVQGSRLCLWAMEAGPDGAMACTQRRAIELEKLLPSRVGSVIGFADGVGVFFLRTYIGIFTFELKSGRVKKVSISNLSVIPYMSFYTPDQAGAIMPPASMASSSENIEAARGEHHAPLLPQPSREAGEEEEEGEWEEEANEEEEGGEEVEKALQRAQELFDKGSNAIVDRDFTDAVDCFSCTLKIRVAHCGKLSPNCANTYYKYGFALLHKALSKSAPSSEKGDTEKDLNLAWKMLHIARAILEKSPGSTMEKEDMDSSLGVYLKVLAILVNMVEPNHPQIVLPYIHVCSYFTSKFGDVIPYCAKAISLCKTRIENLENFEEALLADNSSAAEGGLEKSSLYDQIEFLTILQKAVENLEQKAMSTPTAKASGEQNVGDAVPRAASLTSSQIAGPSNAMSTAATTGSIGTDLGIVGTGIKRANVHPISAEPSPKRLAEDDSPSVSGGSSSDSDAHHTAQDGDDSVSK